MTCRACLRRLLTVRREPSVSSLAFRAYSTPNSTTLAAGLPYHSALPEPAAPAAGPSRLPSASINTYSHPSSSPLRPLSPSPIPFQSSRQSLRHYSRASFPLRPVMARSIRPHSHRGYATVIPHSIENPVPSSSKNPPVQVTAPSLEAIKEEGYLDDDVQLIPPDEAVVQITPQAVAQLVKITSRESPEVLKQGKLALRVGVESGGCHGYQYTMSITEERGVDDYVFQPEGVECIPVVIDVVSLGILKGATLTFTTELIGSSFQIAHNPQADDSGACGCGISFSVKAVRT